MQLLKNDEMYLILGKIWAKGLREKHKHPPPTRAIKSVRDNGCENEAWTG